MNPAPVRGNTEYPSPTPDDAVALAITTFEDCERVDMARIAQDLGVGRSTLYRWVGGREALMDRVMDHASLTLAQSSRRRVRGKGLDRVVSAVRVYLEATTNYEPLRSLAHREPRLALQVVLNPDGVFAANTRAGLKFQIDKDLPGVSVSEETLDVINYTNLAMVWAAIAGGFHPRIDRAMTIVRTLIDAEANGKRRRRGVIPVG